MKSTQRRQEIHKDAGEFHPKINSGTMRFLKTNLENEIKQRQLFDREYMSGAMDRANENGHDNL